MSPTSAAESVILDFSQNSIRSVVGAWTLSFSNADSLTLNLSSNEFSSIEGGWFSMSTKYGGQLILSNNKISSIADTAGKLKGPSASETSGSSTVDLSYNALTTIDSAWLNNAQSYLDLSFNSITSISNQPFTMACSQDYINVNLAYNKFTSISGDAFNITCDSMTFNISGNPLTTFPTAQYGLTAREIGFYATQLGLTSVPANLIASLSNFPMLGSPLKPPILILDLSYNNLTSINTGDFVMNDTTVALAALYLNYNKISSIAPNSLPSNIHSSAVE
jgi:hypothetical protein